MFFSFLSAELARKNCEFHHVTDGVQRTDSRVHISLVCQIEAVKGLIGILLVKSSIMFLGVTHLINHVRYHAQTYVRPVVLCS